MSFSLGLPEQQTANISGLSLGGSPSPHIICIGNTQVWFVQWPRKARQNVVLSEAIFSEAGRPL